MIRLPKNVNIIFVVFLLAAASRAIGAEIDVAEWELTTVVRVGGIGENGEVSFTPTNPFLETQSAIRDNSTATSIYDVSWNAAGFFDFLIEGSYALQGNPPVTFSRSTGGMLVRPTVNSMLSVDAVLNFSFPPGDREAILDIVVKDVTDDVDLHRFFERHVNAFTPSGQSAFHPDPVTLLAGHEYAFIYRLELGSFSGNPTELSLGDGYAHFQITPVPAPATGALLLTAAPLLLRRSKRR